MKKAKKRTARKAVFAKKDHASFHKLTDKEWGEAAELRDVLGFSSDVDLTLVLRGAIDKIERLKVPPAKHEQSETDQRNERFYRTLLNLTSEECSEGAFGLMLWRDGSRYYACRYILPYEHSNSQQVPPWVPQTLPRTIDYRKPIPLQKEFRDDLVPAVAAVVPEHLRVWMRSV